MEEVKDFAINLKKEMIENEIKNHQSMLDSSNRCKKEWEDRLKVELELCLRHQLMIKILNDALNEHNKEFK